MDEDPFTCFTRRRIDVRKRSKPSILTIPSGTHLPVTIYQRYWTHIVVPPPLKHFHNVALTAPFSGRITTNLGRAKSWGKSKIFFVSRGLVWRYWNFICGGMWTTWICCGYVIFALVKILQLFKDVYCYWKCEKNKVTRLGDTYSTNKYITSTSLLYYNLVILLTVNTWYCTYKLLLILKIITLTQITCAADLLNVEPSRHNESKNYQDPK